MPEQIYDGRGNPISGNTFLAGVTEDNYVMTIGSITSMPAVSVATGSEVWIKAGSVQTYSPVGVGSVLVISSAGSIGMFGSVAITNASIQVDVTVADYVSVVASGVGLAVSGTVSLASSAGSVGIFGSVYTTGSIVTVGSTSTYGVGSVRIAEQGVNLQVYNSGAFSIVGSLNSIPSWTGVGSALLISSAGSQGIFGSVYVTGSVAITSLITTTEQSVGKAEVAGVPGSVTYVGGNYNGSLFPFRLDLGSYLMIAGSISNMSSTGSEVWIKAGSVQTYNPVGIGSMLIISSAGSIGIFGSTFITGSVTQIGSIQTYNPIGVGSSLVISSAGSIGVYITAGSVTQIGSIALYGIGSQLLISSAGSINVMGSIYSTGSVNIATNPVPIAGSVRLTGQDANIQVYNSGNFSIVGSLNSIPAWTGIGSSLIVSTAGSVGIYGFDSGTTIGTGALRVSVVPAPYSGGNIPIVGSIRITGQDSNLQVYNSGNFWVVGSLSSIPAWTGIGSVLLASTAGSVPIFGSAYITGSVNIATGVLAVSGPVVASDLGSAFYVIGSAITYGSVYITGSVNIASIPSVIGSVRITGQDANIQVYNSGNFSIVGSLNSIPAWTGIGSNIAISTAGSQPVFGSIFTTGSIEIKTSPVPISGTATIAGSVYVTGSVAITSLITTTEQSVGKAEVAGVPGSVTYVGGNYLGSLYGMKLELGSYLMIAGSISSMPAVSVATGSEIWIKAGSVQTYSPVGIGSSLLISTAGSVPVFGSIYTIGSINITSIPSFIGSVNVTNFAQVGSLTTQTIVGSVNVTNFAQIGSLANQYVTGSINVVGGSIALYGIGSQLLVSSAGSVGIFGSVYSLGSVRIATDAATIGSFTSMALGSSYIMNWLGSTNVYGSVYAMGSISQATDPWRITGSVQPYAPLGSMGAYGSVYVTGSVNIVGGSIASYGVGSSLIVSSAGSIGVYITAGSVTQIGSIALYGVGSQLVISSAGSINVVQTAANAPWQVEQQRGAFGFSGAVLIASGTLSNFITPGTGSKIILKGFTASTDEGIKFRLAFSGGTQIGIWNVPPSGAMGLNMIGMEPSGAANQPIAAGLFNAGSLYLTVFTKDSL